MRRGLGAALTRWRTTITYYTVHNKPWQRQLRRETQQIESELRTTLSEKEVEALLACATYTEMAIKELEADNNKRLVFYMDKSWIAREAAKRIMTERTIQRMKEEKWT